MICEGQREGTVATGYASAVMSALVLATTGILIRYLTEVHGIEPIVLAFWRNIFLVTLLFLALECFFPILVEIEQSDLIPLAGFGLVLAIFNFLWTTSVSVNGAGVATFLVYSSVAFTALLGRIVLGEELGLLKVLSIISAVIGCLLVTGGNVAGGKIPEINGVLLGLGSGFCFALYTLLGKTHRNLGYNSWTIMLYSFGFAALFLLIGKVGLEVVSGTVHTLPTSFFSLSLSGWIVLGILAIGPTLIGFWLYTFSLD